MLENTISIWGGSAPIMEKANTMHLPLLYSRFDTEGEKLEQVA